MSLAADFGAARRFRGAGFGALASAAGSTSGAGAVASAAGSASGALASATGADSSATAGPGRKLISRGGTLFARTVLLLPYRDLTGGFKAWRRELIEAIRLRETSGSGYGFQIETTWWAHRRGASIVQVPIVFRERVVGSSKMSGGIVAEALLLVVRLRWNAIRDATAGR